MFGHSLTTWAIAVLSIILVSFVVGVRMALFFGFIAIWMDLIYPTILERRARRSGIL